MKSYEIVLIFLMLILPVSHLVAQDEKKKENSDADAIDQLYSDEAFQIRNDKREKALKEWEKNRLAPTTEEEKEKPEVIPRPSPFPLPRTQFVPTEQTKSEVSDISSSLKQQIQEHDRKINSILQKIESIDQTLKRHGQEQLELFSKIYVIENKLPAQTGRTQSHSTQQVRPSAAPTYRSQTVIRSVPKAPTVIYRYR